MAKLSAVAGLHNPRPFCQPREAVALQDRSTLELIQLLKAEGWVWKPLPRKKSERDELVHSRDSPLEWYSASNTPNDMYLQCLLSRNRLRQDFGIEQIPHYATHPNNLYGALLQGRLIRPAHMPLTNDVEEGAREAPATPGRSHDRH